MKTRASEDVKRTDKVVVMNGGARVDPMQHLNEEVPVVIHGHGQVGKSRLFIHLRHKLDRSQQLGRQRRRIDVA